MALIMKSGNPTYASIGRILVKAGVLEDVAYETLNISLMKRGLNSGSVSEKDIDDLYKTIEEALIISIPREKMSEVFEEMSKLKEHK